MIEDAVASDGTIHSQTFGYVAKNLEKRKADVCGDACVQKIVVHLLGLGSRSLMIEENQSACRGFPLLTPWKFLILLAIGSSNSSA